MKCVENIEIIGIIKEQAFMSNNNIKISIITPLFNTPKDYLVDMILSVEKQTYDNWELCLADASDDEHNYIEELCRQKAENEPRIKYRRLEGNGGISVNSNECAKMATGNYIGILDHDDILHYQALEKVTREIEKYSSEFVYSDEAKFTKDIEKSYGENYKPDFGMDELRAHNYICHFNVFSKELFDEIGGYRKEFDGSQDHDLVLRLCEKAKNIRHISEVLYYWRVHEQSVAMNISAKSYAVDAAINAIQEHLDRAGEYGTVRSTITGLPRYKIDYSGKFSPLVKVVILATDTKEVERLIAESDKSTKYKNIQYIISRECDRQNIRSEHSIVYIDKMSISEISKVVGKDFAVFVDKEVREFSREWLEEMLVLAQNEQVGVVGIKTVRKDGYLLHTGVVYDGRDIRRPYYGSRDGLEGYEAQLTITKNTSMVAGGCILMSGEKLEILSRQTKKINFCEMSLRLFLEGYKNIYTPFACVSFVTDCPIRGRETLLQLWAESKYKIDPFYNKNMVKLKVDNERKLPYYSGGNQGANKIKQKMEILMELGTKTVGTLKNEGVRSVGIKAKNYMSRRKLLVDGKLEYEFISGAPAYKDVLFISGCGSEVPHPHRYRVTHQKEQLESQGIHCDDIYFTKLALEMVRYYTTFVFYRCPYTEMIEEFVKVAREQKKAVLYDIDDLVIDTKYTNQTPYVQKLSKREKKVYDDGVIRMGKTLSLCDGAITTTECLANELKQYVPEVLINRNTASEEMVKCSETALREYKKGMLSVAMKGRSKKNIVIDKENISIGYFSGSITHNVDFEMVLPSIIKIMEEFPKVSLSVVGELELPDSLKPYADRVNKLPFVDYKQLPKLIRSVDINIAPIESGIFNEAKSENKWVEAALVKVPTVASNVGAFKVCIEHNKNGILCENTVEDWYNSLKELVEDAKKRRHIGRNAYDYVMENCVTTKTGLRLRQFIEKMRTPTVAMVLPSTQISGGIMVALKHCEMMREQGYNVLVIASNPTLNYMVSGEEFFPVVYMEKEPVLARIDKMIATMWVTLDYVLKHPDTKERYYLVQGYEPEFYELGKIERKMAYETYNKKGLVKYLTISKWCEKWLKKEFGQESHYAPNGIDTERFYPVKREMNGKIRILIEGDSTAVYKNVDESFRIANKLDRRKYEIWYLSYNGKPKDWYKYDKFLRKVHYIDMPYLYRRCDIILKSSTLESFSYPPLEMMATGGFAVVAPNGGNKEFLINEENCLMYHSGNIDEAIKQIERIVESEEIRNRLYENGIKTAKLRDWNTIKHQVLDLYDITQE